MAWLYIGCKDLFLLVPAIRWLWQGRKEGDFEDIFLQWCILQETTEKSLNFSPKK
jgi:hypothetical protein